MGQGAGSGGRGGAASATVKTKRNIFDTPNPDQAFDLVETIGKGSFGVVHRALSRVLCRVPGCAHGSN